MPFLKDLLINTIYYSNNSLNYVLQVISISQDRVLTIQDVQKDAPRHLAKLSSDSKLPPGQGIFPKI